MLLILMHSVYAQKWLFVPAEILQYYHLVTSNRHASTPSKSFFLSFVPSCLSFFLSFFRFVSFFQYRLTHPLCRILASRHQRSFLHSSSLRHSSFGFVAVPPGKNVFQLRRPRNLLRLSWLRWIVGSDIGVRTTLQQSQAYLLLLLLRWWWWWWWWWW